MKIAFDRLDLNNLRPLFTAYVRTHLEYCAQAVGLYTEQDIKSRAETCHKIGQADQEHDIWRKIEETGAA